MAMAVFERSLHSSHSSFCHQPDCIVWHVAADGKLRPRHACSSLFCYLEGYQSRSLARLSLPHTVFTSWTILHHNQTTRFPPSSERYTSQHDTRQTTYSTQRSRGGCFHIYREYGHSTRSHASLASRVPWLFSSGEVII